MIKSLDMKSLNIGKSHGHDYSNWAYKLLEYYPINYDPNIYKNKCSWWIEKIPNIADKIMSVGSWSGLAEIWIKLNFPEKDVVCTEINPVVCHFLKTRLYFFNLLNKIPVYVEDGFDLKGFPDKCKDLIFHDGLLEHFEESDRIKLLTENLRVAKKVLVIVPTSACLDSDDGGYGDERSYSETLWSEFMHSYFVVEEEFSNKENNHYGCILTDVKSTYDLGF
ncbi:MAG: class I SAM-dependent methyltransferase [archaeon]|nr:class I SAM-dependent methyltransferase [archaeon]